MVGPVASRKLVAYVQERHQVSQRRACRILSLDRSSVRYRPRRQAQSELQQQVCKLAEQRPRFGYRRLTTLLRRAGTLVNHKRVYRIYRQEGLAVRRRQRKRIALGQRPLLNAPSQPGEEWSLDFTQDTLANGRSFRTLNIIDSYSRLCLAIEVDTSLPCARVIRILERLQAEHGLPQRLRIDNGPEFTAQALDAWAYQHAVQLLFIQPGKPMQNGYIESFNGKFRDECLNLHWFLDLDDARKMIDAWRFDYNTLRPHSSLNNLSPVAYLQSYHSSPDSLTYAG
jgi:putative transposase